MKGGSSGWQLAPWCMYWLYIGSAIVVWDASFVLFRPHSLPGGALNFIWLPYNKYIQVDKGYGNMSDGFVMGQSIINVVEVLVCVYGLLELRKATAPPIRGRSTSETDGAGVRALFAIMMSNLATFCKTVLYFLVEICSGFKYIKDCSLFDKVFVWFIPSSFWLIFSALTVAHIIKIFYNKMVTRDLHRN